MPPTALVYGRWQSAIPSRFIDELPAEHIETRVQAGLYGAGRRHLELDEAGAPFAGARRRREPAVGDVTWQAAPRDDSPSAFDEGARVFHQKFGYGRVLAVDGNKLEVAFDKAGTKKVMSGFVDAA